MRERCGGEACPPRGAKASDGPVRLKKVRREFSVRLKKVRREF